MYYLPHLGTVKPRFTAGVGGRQKPAVNQGFRFWGPKLAKKGEKGRKLQEMNPLSSTMVLQIGESES